MLVGSVLGVLFVSLIRRVMVEDPELPFPESVAAAEIHKAGQAGAQGGEVSVLQHRLRRVGVSWAARSSCSRRTRTSSFTSGSWAGARCGWARSAPRSVLAAGGVTTCAAPTRQPGVHRRGLHHRTGTGGAQFLGQRDRLGPADSAADLFPGTAIADVSAGRRATDEDWLGLANAVWRYIVRPIAVGGMMVGTCYTLFRMRKNLIAGLGKAFTELRGSGAGRGSGGPHRALHELEDGLRPDRRDVPA